MNTNRNIIAFALTNYTNYIQYAIVLLYLLRNYDIPIYMVTRKNEWVLFAEQQKIFYKILPKLNVIFIEDYFSNFNLTIINYINKNAFSLKLFSPIYFKDTTDKVLFIDTDIELRKDITQIFEIDMKDNDILAALDVAQELCVNLLSSIFDNTCLKYLYSYNLHYVNTGVVVYNIKNILKHFNNFIKDFAKIIKMCDILNIPFADQGIANIFYKRILILSELYNCRFNWNEHKSIANDAYIFHYCEIKHVLLNKYIPLAQKILQ